MFELTAYKVGVGCSSVIMHSLMVQWVTRSTAPDGFTELYLVLASAPKLPKGCAELP